MSSLCHLYLLCLVPDMGRGCLPFLGELPRGVFLSLTSLLYCEQNLSLGPKHRQGLGSLRVTGDESCPQPWHLPTCPSLSKMLSLEQNPRELEALPGALGNLPHVAWAAAWSAQVPRKATP